MGIHLKENQWPVATVHSSPITASQIGSRTVGPRPSRTMLFFLLPLYSYRPSSGLCQLIPSSHARVGRFQAIRNGGEKVVVTYDQRDADATLPALAIASRIPFMQPTIPTPWSPSIPVPRRHERTPPSAVCIIATSFPRPGIRSGSTCSRALKPRFHERHSRAVRRRP